MNEQREKAVVKALEIRHDCIEVKEHSSKLGWLARYKSDVGLRLYGQFPINHGDGTYSLLILASGKVANEKEAKEILMPRYESSRHE